LPRGARLALSLRGPYSQGVRWLALLFVVVPIVELWLLLRLGSFMGAPATVALVVVTALLGAALAKREGLRVLSSWRRAMSEMRVPEEGITSGVLVLVGAVLLITPGVLTDVFGILLLVPATRRPIAALLEKSLAARFVNAGTVHTRVIRTWDVRPASDSRRRPILDVEGHVVEDTPRGG